MLGQSRRRWAKINPALFQGIVFTGLLAARVFPQTLDIDPMLFQCWPVVCEVSTTLSQHRVNVSCLPGCRGIDALVTGITTWV